MSMAVLKGDGRVVDYTPSAAVAAGDVVLQGAMIGIAPEPIAAGVKGALAVSGIAQFVKGTGDSGLTVGAKAYWNDATKVATSTVGSNCYLGKVVIGTTSEVLVLVDLAGMGNGAGSLGWNATPSATVAASGTGSGDSPITTGFTMVTAANDTKAVTLPAAVAGLVCIVKNNAGADLKVFPASGDKINGGTATTGNLLMADNTAVLFAAYDGTDWYSVSLVAS